ncbi:molybdenum cofactor guanylyltransferase [Tepidiforma sp.]|uniref:molybdenum cofactor guanylyltransferase n=1 Tax=Tepidiforma sp. TaxID=2682230 RepID=UPI002ADD87AB|nr:molybdenum cofactor guanylyltransferase [Tepidiforma sp.]
MTHRLIAVILAGGRSTRFGRDKASAPLRGRPLLQWVADAVAPAVESILVVSARGQQLPALTVSVPVEVIQDRDEGLGPLAGLATAFEAADAELAFAASCDIPLLRPALVARLADIARDEAADVVCPRIGGFPQPLTAVYRPADCRDPFRRAVEIRSGGLRILAAYRGLRVSWPTEPDLLPVDPDLRSFRNANTPGRLAELDRLLDLA